MSEQSSGIVGTSRVRPDAWGKVSGGTAYVDDVRIAGMWVGGTIRSSVPRGRIKAIRRDPSFDWSQVVVLTADDLPGPNVVAMIEEDHPILAAGQVRFVSEAIALVAAPNSQILARALSSIDVEVEEQRAVLSIEEALAQDIIVWGDDNLLAQYHINTGDLDAGFASADIVVEGTYRSGYQEHLYLEPNGVIATPRGGGGVEVLGSLQCPYYIHAAMCKALGLAADQVVVKQAPTGGAFGGKEDFPSVISLHAALLSLRAEHPVKMVYERSEDIRATTKRHPSIVCHRTGVKRDGTLVAADIDVVLDGGAFVTLSPVVLSRSILHAAGPYRIPNVSIRGRAVATNTPPNGAFRGFGAPQSLFAVERQIDKIARELNLDPVDIRRKNVLRDGDRFPFGQVVQDAAGATQVLERAVKLSGYAELRRKVAPHRGIGLSLYMHGGGFTGAGEERIAGKARVRFAAAGDGTRGSIEILVSNVEMGQGASTVLAMIVAEALGTPPEAVRQVDPDTSIVPDSGPTVASRTTMVVGGILVDACSDMTAKLKTYLTRKYQESSNKVSLHAGSFVVPGHPPIPLLDCADDYARDVGLLQGEATYKAPPGLVWDEKAYRGDAYKAYSWGAHVVEVEVDPDTFDVRPVKVTAVVEIGRAINPVLAVGQVEGGTLQALGWGYMEEVKVEKGHFQNDRMTTYIIPTALDTPDMTVEIAEVPYDRGPYGAKGLGELPLDGGAPALAAAITDACGLFPQEIPITPERLLILAKGASGQGAEKPGVQS